MGLPKASRRPKKRPQHGDQFVALYVGENEKSYRELAMWLAPQGIRVPHWWKPTDSTAPLDQRAVPEDTEVVIIDPSNKINNQQRKRLDHICRAELKLFVVTDALTAKGVSERLEHWGYYGAKPVDLEPAPPPPPVPVEAAPPPPPPTEDAPKKIMPAKSLKDAGALITKAREQLGMSRGDLAAKVGCSKSYITVIEAGGAKATNNLCLAVEHAVGLAPNTIPRLSTRENRRIAAHLDPATVVATPPKQSVALVPVAPAPVVVAAPPPPPVVVVPPPPPLPPSAMFAKMVKEASLDDVLAFLHQLHQCLPDHAIERVDMKARVHLHVNYAPPVQQ
jgi:DNA-binding XRE family transcriptional regulator